MLTAGLRSPLLHQHLAGQEEPTLSWQSELLLRVPDASTCRSLLLASREFAAAWQPVRYQWAAAHNPRSALEWLAHQDDVGAIKAICMSGAMADIHCNDDAVLRYAAARGAADLAAFVISAGGTQQVGWGSTVRGHVSS